MNEQIEKLEHGLMICEATGTKLVHIEKSDAEKIIGLLKDQESVIEALKSDFDETFAVLGEQPEIIRCKDCKYCEYPKAEKEWCKKGHLHGNAEKWFCADGERREIDEID